MQTLTKQTPEEKFAALFFAGVDSWIEAGKLVAGELDKNPDFPEKINKKFPEISVDAIYAFDRMGRKELHPRLAMSDSPGAKKLRRLPYPVQEKHLSESVPLLINNKGTWESLKVSVFNLTAEQANQVFDADGIRSEAAQRAWIESKSIKAIAVQVDEPYRIAGRKLVVMHPCQLTAKQLAQLLAQME